jgi:AraC-like DNA-binding protein
VKKLYDLLELILKQPIVPFIRQSEYAVRKPWKSPKRRLLDYLLIYIQEGNCQFWVDDMKYRFQGGDFCLIQPGSTNDLEGLTDTITPYAHFDIFYNADREASFPTMAGQIDLTAYEHLLQPRLNDIYGIDVPVRLQPRNPNKFRDLLLQIVELWQYREPLSQLKAQHLTTELIIILLEDHSLTKPPINNSQLSFNWITSYFSFHLSEPITLQDMAARANMSPSRFSALFKKRFGTSPHQYLLDMRIRHARELLETTDLPQEKISAYCGFADIHHFSKAIKKRTGSPPGSFRNKA